LNEYSAVVDVFEASGYKYELAKKKKEDQEKLENSGLSSILVTCRAKIHQKLHVQGSGNGM